MAVFAASFHCAKFGSRGKRSRLWGSTPLPALSPLWPLHCSTSPNRRTVAHSWRPLLCAMNGHWAERLPPRRRAYPQPFHFMMAELSGGSAARRPRIDRECSAAARLRASWFVVCAGTAAAPLASRLCARWSRPDTTPRVLAAIPSHLGPHRSKSLGSGRPQSDQIRPWEQPFRSEPKKHLLLLLPNSLSTDPVGGKIEKIWLVTQRWSACKLRLLWWCE